MRFLRHCCFISKWLFFLPEVDDLILWSNASLLLAAVLRFKCAVLDPVDGQCSSWIRKTDVFRAATAGESQCGSMHEDKGLTSWRSRNNLFPFSTALVPVCIPHGPYIMRSLGTGWTVQPDQPAVRAYQSKRIIRGCSASFNVYQQQDLISWLFRPRMSWSVSFRAAINSRLINRLIGKERKWVAYFDTSKC